MSSAMYARPAPIRFGTAAPRRARSLLPADLGMPNPFKTPRSPSLFWLASAVALAGGFGLAEPLQNTAVTEFLLADERVRQLTFQKQTLLIRRARLEAQRDGLSTFSPPTPSGATENKDIPGIVANEKNVF